MSRELIQNSIEIATRYRNLPLPSEEYLKVKDSVNRPCRQYILGRECERIYDDYVDGEIPRRRLEKYAAEIGYSESMMRLFLSYAKAIDHLRVIAPEVVDMAFACESRLTIEPIILLGKMSRGEINAALEKLADASIKLHQIFPNYTWRSCRNSRFCEPNQKATKTASIKSTPKPDPDAEVSALTLTIPSWISTISRTFDTTDFRCITKAARQELLRELESLTNTAACLTAIIEE
jgi:hypothetical protein